MEQQGFPDTLNPFHMNPNHHSFGRYHRSLWVERAIAGRKGLDLTANKEIINFLDWYPRVIKTTFSDEFEGIEKFKSIHNHIIGLFLRSLDGQTSILPVSRDYFDNINTKHEETVEEIFLKTLLETVAHLKKEFQSEDPTTWNAA